MMGKSRHMKEVANYLPSVYICLREETRGFGYPRRSPSIAEWLSMGATAAFSEAPIDYHFCLSTLRWSAFIVETIRALARWIDDPDCKFLRALDLSPLTKRLEFAWLWNFFAEPPYPGVLTKFWLQVQMATDTMLQEFPSGESAYAYFQKKHATYVRNAMKQLRQSFAKYQINDNSLPLLFIFDEARVLCNYDAYNGARIYEEHGTDFQESSGDNAEGDQMPFRNFSNFCAVRRALRYLSAGTRDVPRIFAIFTETTSRITNFQPTSWKDPSLRVFLYQERVSFRQSWSFPVSTFILGF